MPRSTHHAATEVRCVSVEGYSPFLQVKQKNPPLTLHPCILLCTRLPSSGVQTCKTSGAPTRTSGRLRGLVGTCRAPESRATIWIVTFFLLLWCSLGIITGEPSIFAVGMGSKQSKQILCGWQLRESCFLNVEGHYYLVGSW